MTRTANALEPALLERVLHPYRPIARYVLDAAASFPQPPCSPQPDDPSTWIAIECNCAISASCYIDDTGHFNAVELNIAYNQMLYAGLAAICERRLLRELPWDLEAFWRHQLPDVLIVDYHAHFPRPVDPRAFRGRFEVREVLPKPHRRMLLLRTACEVRSDDGGHASTEVLIALVRL